MKLFKITTWNDIQHKYVYIITSQLTHAYYMQHSLTTLLLFFQFIFHIEISFILSEVNFDASEITFFQISTAYAESWFRKIITLHRFRVMRWQFYQWNNIFSSVARGSIIGHLNPPNRESPYLTKFGISFTEAQNYDALEVKKVEQHPKVEISSHDTD